MCDLHSVTYHLPLDFWTSLLLKLCDLAVRTVKAQEKHPKNKKRPTQKHKTAEVIQCVCLWEAEGERHTLNYTFVCMACLCLCMLGSIKQVVAYGPAAKPQPPPGSPPPT